LFITAGANSSEYIPNVSSVDDTLARWRFFSDKKGELLIWNTQRNNNNKTA
jgi:hypothetical protein